MNRINFESFEVIFDLVCILELWMNCVGVKYLGYRGSPVTAQNSEYDRFPPETNG
jgi:hypothetical protein